MFDCRHQALLCPACAEEFEVPTSAFRNPEQMVVLTERITRAHHCRKQKQARAHKRQQTTPVPVIDKWKQLWAAYEATHA
jgi:hypothetical protein